MRKIKGLRWYMIALVTLGTVLGYLTRNTVAAAAPTLMEELNISTQQYSYIIAAYSAAYTVMQPVAGYVLMNPLMILVKIIKLRWIHILSYDQMVSRKINNQTTRCANSIFYTTLFTNSAPNYT